MNDGCKGKFGFAEERAGYAYADIKFNFDAVTWKPYRFLEFFVVSPSKRQYTISAVFTSFILVGFAVSISGKRQAARSFASKEWCREGLQVVPVWMTR